jgi:YD repeat-containing protein
MFQIGINTKKVALFVLLLFASWLLAESIQYSYDGAGRLIKAYYGAGKTITYTYDNAGNLLNRQAFTPCFDWNNFSALMGQWPTPASNILNMVPLTECPKKEQLENHK